MALASEFSYDSCRSSRNDTDDFSGVSAITFAAGFDFGAVIGHDSLHSVAGKVNVNVLGIIGKKESKTIRVAFYSPCDPGFAAFSVLFSHAFNLEFCYQNVYGNLSRGSLAPDEFRGFK